MTGLKRKDEEVGGRGYWRMESGINQDGSRKNRRDSDAES